MFYDEVDVESVVTIANEMFGKSGVMLDGKNVMRNVTLATREFGKIWYGDMDTIAMSPQAQCSVLSQRINQTVYMFNNSNTFDYTAATKFSPTT
jgi:hypothetical protein